MYDFYGKPPKTREDLREWLTTWLMPTYDEREIAINGEVYKEEFGFKRAFYNHSVFRNVRTNEYKWYVKEDCRFDYVDFPKESYPSYESLIDGVVEYYYKLWRLDKNVE